MTSVLTKISAVVRINSITTVVRIDEIKVNVFATRSTNQNNDITSAKLGCCSDLPYIVHQKCHVGAPQKRKVYN